jgi:HAD superfamily hydrolase (TIGR01509 family)
MAPFSLIFDCDGVLVDSEVINIAVERKHLALIGLEYTTEAYQRRFVGLSDADFINSLKQDYLALGKGPFPPHLPADIATECAQRFETELVAIDGIEHVLDAVSVPIAVASSSRIQALHKKLHLTDLHTHFAPHIYSGEQVENGKPAPDLFLLAAQQLGQKPEQCIIIEDSINGVEAGLAAGMEVWGFTGGGHANDELTGHLRETGAHRVFSSYQELPGLIERYRSGDRSTGG